MTNEQRELNLILLRRNIQRKEFNRAIGCASPTTGYAKLKEPGRLTVAELRLLKLSDAELINLVRSQVE